MQNNIEKNIRQWIALEDLSNELGISIKSIKEKCRSGKFVYRIEKCGKKLNYYILTNAQKEEERQSKEDSEYSNAPRWAKLQAEKYITILNSCKGLKGEALKSFIQRWNKENTEAVTSYSCVIKMRKRFNTNGINGLLAKYGHHSNNKIKEEYFDYFKNLYLKEGGPSLYSCWESTLGYAMREYGELRIYFPSHMSFKRRIEKEIPRQSIYLARKGQSAWNRKYGNYIERDYSTIICGKVWVSDHAQIDIACLTEDGKVVFPWVTAWRDYKSGKWLGWLLQSGHPNSDHIFQTFYYAALKYGIPEDVIIDNGKDYRCKDFAGGRNVLKINPNKTKTTSMLSELNVNVNFALPYNAQTKPIERDFLKIKELLSKHSIGYRGGNIIERPEKLAKEIRTGKILPFNTLKTIFDDFIINILNKRPSQGKNHKGLSPDEVFQSEFNEKITVSKDALKLFCMRTSKNFTIGRNGIKDNEFGITYWSDWMISKTGQKVYLRRDILNYKDAWVFDSATDEFVGNTRAVRAVAALHADIISKDEFKESMSNKKRNLKIARSYIQQTREIPLKEQCENYKQAYKKVEKETQIKVSRIANTNMDKAIRKSKEMAAIGKQDLSIFIPDADKGNEHIYLFETDKIIQEELKGVVNGH